MLRRIGIAAGVLALVVAVLAVLVPSVGIESDWLRGQAERAIVRLAGQQVDARIGRTTLALDRRHFLAIGIDDLTIAQREQPEPFAEVGRVGLGVRFWPLLSGRVEIGSATLSDARVSLPGGLAPPASGEGIFTEEGLIEPDRLLDLVFTQLEQLVRQVGPAGFEAVRLQNVTIGIAGANGLPEMTIVSGRLAQTGHGAVEITAKIAVADHVVAVSGEAEAAAAGTARFNLELAAAGNGRTYEFGGKEPEDRGSVRLGDMTLVVAGVAGGPSEAANIALSGSVAPSDVTVGTAPAFAAEADFRLRLTKGAGALWIDRVDLAAARSSFAFSGQIVPQPATEDGENGATYGFRLIGPQINVAPGDSPEPALAAIARLTGWIAPDGRRIVATDINVATGQGEVIGSGALEIVPGMAPGISLAIAVAQMPVSHAKNLWPFFAAPGARRWALANVFGGTVENSRLLLRVEPGRLGRGIPLSGDEVSGHFEVRNARFDVAGTIPPIRDAVGAIDFAGTNVDISLRSGTVFMESGRTLAARNGTLTIKDAHVKPLIGIVDIEIDGAAAAVTEVAGYEPINLSDYLPISPDGISGTAKGRVLANVPLEDNIDRDDLDWHLELAYEGLSLAEPYEGQRIEDARGTIVAGPDMAIFEAEARLNGIRGELSLAEPLGIDKTNRARKARLFLQPGDADKLFDGLSEMVQGPLTVNVEQLGPGEEKVSVDLGGAKFSLPWIGWAKEKGVAAAADFTMRRDDKTTRLENFRLNGDGFGGTGALTIDNKGLASARFSQVAFAPGDNVAMGIDRKGNGYAFSVSGQALDARFLIKQFGTLETGIGGGGSGAGMPVTINAEISSVTGFNGEKLTGAKFAYADGASAVPGLRVSASTAAGARTAIVDASAGGARKVEIKADDAGAVLRFMDIYDKLVGGRAALSLSGPAGGVLGGQLEMRDFSIIDETRLESMVKRAPPGAGRSLNDAVKRDVDVSRASFDRGFASIEMGKDYMSVANGVVSGPMVGSKFDGTVFDAAGNMSISGTFLPAYGINRLFGEIPLLGQILGNGRGGGLIGITYRLSGPVDAPKLEINPLSVVAPGIFRSIFEFR